MSLDPTITVPRVFLSTLPPVVLTDKMLVSTTSFYVNVTTEQVSQKDVSYPPNGWYFSVLYTVAICNESNLLSYPHSFDVLRIMCLSENDNGRKNFKEFFNF